MYNKNTNYISILIFLLIVSSIFNTFFISILFIGIIFEIFMKSIEKKYIYTFIFSILSFNFIEAIFGFPSFLLLLISLFTYFILIPKIKHLFSSKLIGQVTYIFIFYSIFFLTIILIEHYSVINYKIFIYNFFIDSIIIGLFI